MAGHRNATANRLTAALVRLGTALGYESVSEFRITATGAAVDVAWLRGTGGSSPLFVFEIESAASSSAANNPTKVYGQPLEALHKPLFFFHVFLEAGESERIPELLHLFGTQNYMSYRLDRGDAHSLLVDIFTQHRRLDGRINLEPVIREITSDEDWADGRPRDVLIEVERLGFEACYVPVFAARAISDRGYMADFLRQIDRREPYPSPTENECWYGTWLGEHLCVPLHLGVMAHESPEVAGELARRFMNWQERSTFMTQIGPHFGLSRDYDLFLVGVSPSLLALVAGLFRTQNAVRYCAVQLLTVLEPLHADGPAAQYVALWALWIAAAGGDATSYESARAAINASGGLNARFLANPPGALDFDERDDAWFTHARTDAVEVPPMDGFASRYLAAGEKVDLPLVALRALLNDETIYRWGDAVAAGLREANSRL